MQPFVTRKEAVSNNNHNAFSALKGANLALMQSIQSHKSHFPAASILQVPTCPYVSVAAAQPALNYLVGTPASSSPRRRTETPAAVHASSLIPASLVFSSGSAWYVTRAWSDVDPHAGAGKHVLAPQGQCSHGR